MKPKYTNNKLLHKVYNEGVDDAVRETAKELAILRHQVLVEVADEIDNIIRDVPGVGDVIHKRIVEAVEKRAEEYGKGL